MTKEEKMIISAYTGVLMVDKVEFYKYASKILKRPVYRYEFEMVNIWETLRREVKEDFLKLCE